MNFRLEDIPPEGLDKILVQEEPWMDECLNRDPVKNFRFLGPITVHLHLFRSGRTVLVKSRMESRVEGKCARCLEPYAQRLTSEYVTSFNPKPNLPLPEELELSREDLETDFYEGKEVDVTSLVQDQVLLALPPKGLCREECRGLCPRCGKNLNREVCQCTDGKADPRFASLKNFRIYK